MNWHCPRRSEILRQLPCSWISRSAAEEFMPCPEIPLGRSALGLRAPSRSISDRILKSRSKLFGLESFRAVDGGRNGGGRFHCR